MIDPNALGTVAADNPQIAGLILSDIRQRLAARDLLEAMKEAGLDTETPSFLFLESLLRSGAIDPDRALQYYLKLQQAQVGMIEIQSKYMDLLMKKAQIRYYDAMTMGQLQGMNLDTQKAVSEQIKAFYEPRLKMIEKEKEELNSYLRTVANSIRQMDPVTMRKIDARLRALDLSQTLLAEQQRQALYYANEYMKEGLNPFTAVTRAVATANADVMNQFTDWAEEGVLGLPDTKQVEFGKVVGEEMVQVMSTYVDPNYGMALKSILKFSTGGAIPVGKEKDEGGSWAETIGTGAAIVGAGFGAKKAYDWWKRRRAPSGYTEEGKPKTEAKGKEARVLPVKEVKTSTQARTGGTVNRVNRALGAGRQPKALPRGAITQPPARAPDTVVGIRKALPSRTEPIPQPAGAPIRKALPSGLEKGWVDKQAELIRQKYKLQDNAKALQQQIEKAIEVLEKGGTRQSPSRVDPLGRRMGGFRTPIVRGFGVGSVIGTILPMLLESRKKRVVAPEEEFPVY